MNHGGEQVFGNNFDKELVDKIASHANDTANFNVPPKDKKNEELSMTSISNDSSKNFMILFTLFSIFLILLFSFKSFFGKKSNKL